MKTKMIRKSFNFRVEWMGLLSSYSGEIRLKVYEAVIRYVATGVVPSLDSLTKMAFLFIRREVDADFLLQREQEERETKEEKRIPPIPLRKEEERKEREEVEKEEKRKREIEKRKETVLSLFAEEEAGDVEERAEEEITEEDDSGVNIFFHEEKEKESVPRKEKEKENLQVLDELGVSDGMRGVVEEWFRYKRERGESYRPMGVKQFYRRLSELSGDDPEVARKITQRSMANNWAGIFSLKDDERASRGAYGAPTEEELFGAVASGLARAATRQEWE